MSNTYQRRYQVNNGTDYDEYHFLTDASLVNMSDGSNVENKVTSHIADNIKHISYATTTNSGNNYLVSINGISSLTDGLQIRVKFNAASTGAITLNVNSLGAKNIVDYFGNVVANVRINLIANLCYESTSGNFILQGEGGEYGTATQADVLNTATFGTEQGVKPGTMNLSNLTPDNVRENVNINGVIGTLDIGKRWVSGSLIADSVGTPYLYASSGSSSFYSVSCNNLLFKPRIIVLYYLNTGQSWVDCVIYSGIYPFYSDAPSGVIVNFAVGGSNTTASSYNIKLSSPASVSESGFVLPVRTAKGQYYYVAFE